MLDGVDVAGKDGDGVTDEEETRAGGVVPVELAVGVSVVAAVVVGKGLTVKVRDALIEQENVVRTEDVGVGVEDIGAKTMAVPVPVREPVWDTVADAS